MKYLVVDDEAVICEGTARRLKHFINDGDTVKCAYSAENALKVIDSFMPDILITDIRMREIDGLTLIERCKALNPQIACVIITAYDSFRYAQQAIKLEVKDFLVKPYNEEDLKLTIERIIASMDYRQERQVACENQLYEALVNGNEISDELLPFDSIHDVRVVIWAGSDDFIPIKIGSHCLRDISKHYMLTDAQLKEIEEVFYNANHIHVGISERAETVSVLWKQARIALAVAEAFSEKCVFYSKILRDNGGVRSSSILKAINYISIHLGKPVSMEDICSHLHVNYSTFSRQFKQQTGASFSEYLNMRQMEWAFNQIKNGMRVSEAADALGYSTPESFTKAFIRVYGSAPRTLRIKEDISR